jgi:transcriptional regulator with XRE-family HTH domain
VSAVKEVCTQLGLVIRQRREALGLSQGDLAALVQTQRPLVSRVESQRHVLSLETLERYARALECRPSELLAAAELLALADSALPCLEVL